MAQARPLLGVMDPTTIDRESLVSPRNLITEAGRGIGLAGATGREPSLFARTCRASTRFATWPAACTSGST
jgi:hypothetical protein